MQLNIAMKCAEYVVWILLRRPKHCQLGEKNYYNFRDIEYFPGDTFWRSLWTGSR